MKQFINYKRPADGRRFFPAILALVLGAGSAYGAKCTVSTSGVSFGVYDVFSTGNNEATGYINVSCNAIGVLVSYNILLSTGGGSFASRSMASGSHNFAYNLYTTSGYSIVWGDGTGGTGTVSDSFPKGENSRDRDHAVYGRIPAGQNAYVGNYSDTITVTINY